MDDRPDRKSFGAPKLAVFWLVLVLLVLGTLELATRAFFAAQIGRSVFWYGTSFERAAVGGTEERSSLLRSLRHRRMSGAGEENHSVRRPDNMLPGYYKYFSHQPRTTYDVDTGEVYPATINSRGFRGPEFSETKPEGTIRILTLGASSTFGYHNRDDLTYPAQLERLLGERCPALRWEVLNLGIPHLVTRQILALFLADGVPLHPDVVTFYEGFNDAGELGTETQDSGTPVAAAPPRSQNSWKLTLRWLRGRFLLVALSDALVADWTKRYTPEFVEAHIETRRRVFLEQLDELAEASRELGVELILASQQARSLAVLREHARGVGFADELSRVEQQLEEKGWVSRYELAFLTHAKLMQAEAEFARQHGLAYVDTLAALDGDRDQLVSWVHLSHEGNRLVAESLAGAILPRMCPGLRAAPAPLKAPAPGADASGQPPRDPA